MDRSESSVGQILIPVDDLDRAIDFYRDLLGLRYLFSAPLALMSETAAAAGSTGAKG